MAAHPVRERLAQDLGAWLTGSAAPSPHWGIWLSQNELGRYGTSSKIVLALGLATAVLAIDIAVGSFDLRAETAAVITGAIALPVIGFVAYRFGNIFALVLALVGLFQWVGAWTAMFGRSGYEIGIQDPRLMSAAALVAVLVGAYHELRLRERTGRFFQAYEAVGLVYLNLSLLIMSSDGDALRPHVSRHRRLHVLLPVRGSSFPL